MCVCLNRVVRTSSSSSSSSTGSTGTGSSSSSNSWTSMVMKTECTLVGDVFFASFVSHISWVKNRGICEHESLNNSFFL